MAKAADLLGLRRVAVPVDHDTRRMQPGALTRAAREVRDGGARFVVATLNLGTTMFGSIDDPAAAARELDAAGVDYRFHVDAAFGGFLYPFVADNPLSFRHLRVETVSMDAHKMLQAPYGTGILLARKDLLEHVATPEAEYVPGGDHTVCGSRSGANAVAVWMILHAHGSEGSREFLSGLLARTDRLCAALDSLGVRYFREPGMNVVALRAADVPAAVAGRHGLVADRHTAPPRFYKVVVMDHVAQSALDTLAADLAATRAGMHVA